MDSVNRAHNVSLTCQLNDGRLGKPSYEFVMPHPGWRNLGLSNIQDYFGIWAIERTRAINYMLHLANDANWLNTHMRRQSDNVDPGGGLVEIISGDVALVRLEGTLMKRASSLDASTSTVLARRQIRLAANDDDIRGIVLLIDSPGGTVSGTADLAAEVKVASEKKPLDAFIEDLGASAAYEIASQARRIFANKTALIGAIGTFSVLRDTSKLEESRGVTVHVVRAGSFKGMGVEGTAITEEQITELQRIVDQLNEEFIVNVAAGRKLSIERTRALADGRVHIAADAARLGLIDGISTFDETIGGLFSDSTKGDRRMTTIKLYAPNGEPLESTQTLNTDASCQIAIERTEVKPATLLELQHECVGASAEFLVGQLEIGASLDQSRRSWMLKQQQTNHALRQGTLLSTIGVEALKDVKSSDVDVSDGEQDAETEWNAKHEAYTRKFGGDRRRATRELVKDYPELQIRFVVDHNAGHGRKERGEKFRDMRAAA